MSPVARSRPVRSVRLGGDELELGKLTRFPGAAR